MIVWLAMLGNPTPRYHSALEYWRSAIAVAGLLLALFPVQRYPWGHRLYAAFLAWATAWGLGGVAGMRYLWWVPFGEGSPWQALLVAFGLAAAVVYGSWGWSRPVAGWRERFTIFWAACAAFFPALALPSMM